MYKILIHKLECDVRCSQCTTGQDLYCGSSNCAAFTPNYLNNTCACTTGNYYNMFSATCDSTLIFNHF